MFNFFEELFAPGRKHTAEEQKRLELSRVDLGIGDPARGPIDLTSGKVTLRHPTRTESTPPDDREHPTPAKSSPSGDREHHTPAESSPSDD
ncbi:DUF6191 domain-containing protein [Streptomyces sp. NBC_01102]|uniref:DUF6191 domain-containing protein n=1 Tax=unclassified Streptomyces TaxID=2593676 RepID=UPI00386BE904|nr:DUF6191 domain-containing protein [Streptomyces sp. NBC_01102]